MLEIPHRIPTNLHILKSTRVNLIIIPKANSILFIAKRFTTSL